MITVIPAIDLIDGCCVRLSQGKFDQKTEYGDPLTVAKRFEDAGLKRLHLVDLDGARSGNIVHLHILEAIAAKTNLRVDFSGGIKTTADVDRVLNAGASWICLGSIAWKHPLMLMEWAAIYGSEKIIIGADVQSEMIVINGWQQQTTTSLYDFIRQFYENGLRNFFCTDISLDGMLAGPATELYRRILSRFPDLCLIASGGIAGSADLNILEEVGCKGAIIGKAIYEGAISFEELTQRTIQ
jgi:phosphoribosylformimino-5-aminoimidazole carboxamide ribotide isomerase